MGTVGLLVPPVDESLAAVSVETRGGSHDSLGVTIDRTICVDFLWEWLGSWCLCSLVKLTSVEVPGSPTLRGSRMPRMPTREACVAGGRSTPAEKRSFFTDRKLAVEAGRKGGASLPPDKRSFFTNRELAIKAGRAGGRASAEATARRRKENV